MARDRCGQGVISSVGRAVVYHDDLEIPVRKDPDDPVDQGSDCDDLIAGGNYHADVGCGGCGMGHESGSNAGASATCQMA